MSRVSKILVTDDDADLRQALVDQLALHPEFVVLEAGSAAEAMSLVKSASPDILIMDVGLPDMDGREAVQQMRKDGFTHPVIMLTGHTDDEDAIRGLDLGANDYVTKPFRFAVLLARIRAHLRVLETSDEAILTIGSYTFRPGSKLMVNEKGARIRLTEKETGILRFLYRAGGDVVSRDVLLREVWGYNAEVTTHTLETHIYRLRQKIETDPQAAKLLATEPGGYKLIP